MTDILFLTTDFFLVCALVVGAFALYVKTYALHRKKKHRECMMSIVRLEIQTGMGLVWAKDWLDSQDPIEGGGAYRCYGCSRVTGLGRLCPSCIHVGSVTREKVMSNVYSIDLPKKPDLYPERHARMILELQKQAWLHKKRKTC